MSDADLNPILRTLTFKFKGPREGADHWLDCDVLEKGVNYKPYCTIRYLLSENTLCFEGQHVHAKIRLSSPTAVQLSKTGEWIVESQWLRDSVPSRYDPIFPRP